MSSAVDFGVALGEGVLQELNIPRPVGKSFYELDQSQMDPDDAYDIKRAEEASNVQED